MLRTSITQRVVCYSVEMGAKLQKNKVEGRIYAETGGNSQRIVSPGQTQAGHQCNHHNQQTHLQKPD